MYAIRSYYVHPDQATLIGQDIAAAQQLAPLQEQACLATIIQGYLETALDTGIDGQGQGGGGHP